VLIRVSLNAFLVGMFWGAVKCLLMIAFISLSGPLPVGASGVYDRDGRKPANEFL
jgi:hypothetical protein